MAEWLAVKVNLRVRAHRLLVVWNAPFCAQVTYSVKRGAKPGTGELHTEMEAKHIGGGSAEDGGGNTVSTPVNLTNHAYWNLSGDRKRSVRGHGLVMRCDRYLPLDDNQVRRWGAPDKMTFQICRKCPTGLSVGMDRRMSERLLLIHIHI